MNVILAILYTASYVQLKFSDLIVDKNYVATYGAAELLSDYNKKPDFPNPVIEWQ